MKNRGKPKAADDYVDYVGRPDKHNLYSNGA